MMPKCSKLFSSFVVAAGLLAPNVFAHEVDLTRIPLGDGRLSSKPVQGSIFACQQRFNPNAPGAHSKGDWLNGDGTYDLTRKVWVSGAVTHVSELEISVVEGERKITGNALPSHTTGVFPIARSDEAFQYDRNPNRIRAHEFEMLLPAVPQLADTASCVPMGAIGIMLTGAVLFNSLDARGTDAVAYEILDECQGHPQQQGLYHYHGISSCQETGAEGELEAGDASPILIGFAFDGFGIFGPRSEEGHMLSTEDLDECHGHVGKVEWDGASQEIYHYHATRDYPHMIGCYKGTPQELPGLSGPGGRRP